MLSSITANVSQLHVCCRKRKRELKTNFNITSVFSAEKLNGNSAKQLL